MDFSQKQKFSKLKKIKKDQENLPIYKFRDDILRAVKDNQVTVVAGDTGCGKSTQVPQYLLAAGFENIACTQPRRIACMALTKRVSYETLNEYGSEVAYQVRFEKTRTERTRIVFLTEGLLLRQITSDPLLTQYSVIVIDEVHERHIHTDFLLGVIKCILMQRSELKLVLMSATINIELFSSYFDCAPVVSVPGRLYPIQLTYMPVSVQEQGSKTQRLDPSPFLGVLQSIDHKYPTNERGDVLMFLSGMSEIMAVVEAAKLYAQKTKKWIILPLHSSLSIEDQDKVFDFPPEGVRKCIVSTNIAETSVTIDGVRFVVDSGKVKEMSYDTKYRMQRLQEFWISRASAEQRKGRAGRTGPGVCYRLYSQEDYEALQQYSTPEIQRVPLDSLILQMISMGLPDVTKFPFIEPPDSVAIEYSVKSLREQGALTAEDELTPIGQMLSQLPVDVVIGKMLIMASLFEMEDPVLTICAALSIQSPFTSKGQRDPDALGRRKDLESEHGDPLMLLNAYTEWIQVKTRNQDSRKWCNRRGLEEQRFYEMSKLKKQFKELLQEHGLIAKPIDKELSQELYGGDGFKTREQRQKIALHRKRLRELRHQERTQGKKAKVLKMDSEDWSLDTAEADDDEVEEDASVQISSNIKDLEFRLTHDLSKVQSAASMSQSLTAQQINTLKLILSNGLYPQVAIADEHNSFKPDSEMAYHCRNKGFVLLHPTCVFSNNPEPLQTKVTEGDSQKASKHGDVMAQRRGEVSNSHQLLAYVSLLETNKPYLMNVMRVPALQTLLLFASSIDTNADCTRLLCDGWLEICLNTDPENTENILSTVVRLRDTWWKLVQLKLEAHETTDSVEGHFERGRLLSTIHHQQKEVAKKLSEFLHSDVLYTVRRVLPAESAKMYINTSAERNSYNASILEDIISESGCKQHPTKGGVQVTSFLVVGCLCEESSSSWGDYTYCVQKHWTCQICGESRVVTLAERLIHELKCTSNTTTEAVADSSESSSIPCREYHCEVCGKDLKLSTTDLLKHRKTCTG